MAGKGIGGHHKSPMSWVRPGSDDWVTPKWVVDKLGPFDLDPCCPYRMPWKTAEVMLTKSEDGLLVDWGNDFFWCNPPYGRSTARWLEKCALHENGIALVFARTETEMFFRHVWRRARSLLFLSGRLTFVRPNGEVQKTKSNRRNHNAGGPSVLIAYGREADCRLRHVDIPGVYIPLKVCGVGPVITPGRCTEVEKKNAATRKHS